MKKLLLPALLLIGSPAHAEQALTNSLFFSPDEVQKIEMMAAKDKTPVKTASNDVHLGAVFYYSPDDWVLWLQGERWTPATEREDVHVVEVTPDYVCLLVEPTPATPTLREVKLKPYQTYQLASGLVTEGGVIVPASDSR